MKKSLVICLLAGALAGQAQQPTQTLRFGIQTGFQHNFSEWDGGMDEASGRFQSNEFTGVAFALTARYDVCDRFYLTSGTGFYQWGFNYSLAKNYSFTKGSDEIPYAYVELSSIEIPIMGHVKSKLNCMNSRWIAGLGFSAAYTDVVNHKEFADPDNEGNQNSGFSTTVNVSGGVAGFLRLSAGCEHVTKKGGIFQIEFLASLGLKELARSNVKYMDEGRQFNHEFTNTGSYTGLRMTFYFGLLNKEIPVKKQAKL